LAVRRPFLHPFWLVLSLPGYIGWRLLPPLTRGPLGLSIGILMLLGVCLLILGSVRLRSKGSGGLARLLTWSGLIAMGFFSSLFVATLLRDVILVGASLVLPPDRAAAWVTPSAIAVLALTAASCILGFWRARHPRLVEVDVPIRALPLTLHGFSIAQISDLHVGPTIRRGFVARIVERVNRLEADVVAVTGDLVDGSVAQLGSETAPLAALRAPLGVYFVTGNHEYYSGEREWTREITRLGLSVLKNAHVVLRRGETAVVLAGVTDYSAQYFDPAQRSDPAAALRGAPAAPAVRILLAHQPNTAAAAAEAGFDLQISGHTHGGQFLPWNFFVGFFQPFTSGLYQRPDLSVYVSRGTGYWGPPNRFGVPGEITRLRLVPATKR
jgi:predicted MPP superfamily phosphohydrolase